MDSLEVRIEKIRLFGRHETTGKMKIPTYDTGNFHILMTEKDVTKEVFLSKDEIKSIQQDYEKLILIIHLKVPIIRKIKNVMNELGLDSTNLKNRQVELHFFKSDSFLKTEIMNFFSSVQPYDEDEETDHPVLSSTRGRKKKINTENDVEDGVSSAKKSKKTVAAAAAPPTTERQLRSRHKNTPIVIDDEEQYEDNDEELKLAIELSKKSLVNNAQDCTVIESDDVPDLYAHIDKTIELFQYPFDHGIDGKIDVKMEDYLCLGRAEYLSDVIIDFYLSYIFREKFTDELRDKVYIFSSQFYSIYSVDSSYPGWKSEENVGKSAVQKRYERVAQMLDPNVNIFEKEFLIFPLFQSNHWFLAIVCFPKLCEPVTFDGNHPLEEKFEGNFVKMRDPKLNPIPVKQSCILTFDSIKSNASRRTIAMIHIRRFLKSHWEHKYKGQFELGSLSACSIQCPTQTNNVDCGCFLLEFVEHFFIKDPLRDYCLPITKNKWFSSKDVLMGKRREIQGVIKQVMENNLSQIALPELHFHSERLSQDAAQISNENGNEENDNSNNNNEEEFNNNNDFECLDSNNETATKPLSPSSSMIIPKVDYAGTEEAKIEVDTMEDVNLCNLKTEAITQGKQGEESTGQDGEMNEESRVKDEEEKREESTEEVCDKQQKEITVKDEEEKREESTEKVGDKQHKEITLKDEEEKREESTEEVGDKQHEKSTEQDEENKDATTANKSFDSDIEMQPLLETSYLQPIEQNDMPTDTPKNTSCDNDSIVVSD